LGAVWLSLSLYNQKRQELPTQWATSQYVPSPSKFSNLMHREPSRELKIGTWICLHYVPNPKSYITSKRLHGNTLGEFWPKEVWFKDQLWGVLEPKECNLRIKLDLDIEIEPQLRFWLFVSFFGTKLLYTIIQETNWDLELGLWPSHYEVSVSYFIF